MPFTGLQMPSLLHFSLNAPLDLHLYLSPLASDPLTPMGVVLGSTSLYSFVPFFLALPLLLVGGNNLCWFSRLLPIPINVCMEKPNHFKVISFVTAANYWSISACSVLFQLVRSHHKQMALLFLKTWNQINKTSYLPMGYQMDIIPGFLCVNEFSWIFENLIFSVLLR